MSRPTQNTKVSPIPKPTGPESLPHVVLALKNAVEALSGQSGDTLDRAVTFRDLVNLGLVIEAKARTV